MDGWMDGGGWFSCLLTSLHHNQVPIANFLPKEKAGTEDTTGKYEMCNDNYIHKQIYINFPQFASITN